MNLKEKISDFQSLMKSCINDMKIEGEENLLNYFRETYCSSFNTEIYTRIDTKITEETIKLSDILYHLLEDDKNNFEKNTGYLICQTYQAMKNNLKDHEKYKKSNALQFFCGIKKQFQKVKSNLDDNFKMIYTNYIKHLVNKFEFINLNLLGNNLCREKKIEDHKQKIDASYKIYSKIIQEEIVNLYIKSLNQIDDYINKIDSFPDPKKKGIEIGNQISKLNDNFIKFVNDKIKEYKTQLEKIIKELQNLIKLNNSTLTHIGITISEGAVGAIGFFLFGISGPIGWIVAGGIHGIVAGYNYRKDKSNEKQTLKENMKNLREQLIVKFEGYKMKIDEYLIELKNDTQKQIENFVDSQNSEFKRIKEHKNEYDNIYNEFKKMFYEEEEKK